jgi:hypothetical protein
MEKQHDQHSPIFTEQGMRNIAAYLDALKRIHIRLTIEGYRIVDGRIVHPGQQSEIESQSEA